MNEAERIAAGLALFQTAALLDCVERGSTRGNDGGLYDDVLSGLCSNSSKGINNGWLVTWSMNPTSREDGYINLYTPTELGREVVRRILSETPHAE